MDFDQKKFAEKIFTFIKENEISVRAFCKTAGCAPITIYRARDPNRPLRLDTIRRLEAAMQTYLEGFL